MLADQRKGSRKCAKLQVLAFYGRVDGFGRPARRGERSGCPRRAPHGSRWARRAPCGYQRQPRRSRLDTQQHEASLQLRRQPHIRHMEAPCVATHPPFGWLHASTARCRPSAGAYAPGVSATQRRPGASRVIKGHSTVCMVCSCHVTGRVRPCAWPPEGIAAPLKVHSGKRGRLTHGPAPAAGSREPRNSIEMQQCDTSGASGHVFVRCLP